MDQPATVHRGLASWLLNLVFDYFTLFELVRMIPVCKLWRDHIYKQVCPRGPNAISLTCRFGHFVVSHGENQNLLRVVKLPIGFMVRSCAIICSGREYEERFQCNNSLIKFQFTRSNLTIIQHKKRHRSHKLQISDMPPYHLLKLIWYLENPQHI
jgi:hypothetical protein